jgi:hypothetical protein
MKTLTLCLRLANSTKTFALSFPLLCGWWAGDLIAQTPCPDLQVIATGLIGPSKVIQTSSGNFLVAEVGPPDQLNSARISIVDQSGNRRTLLEGLPSARAFVGDLSGTSGLWLQGRTLYVLNGQGDTTLAGPVQGTEKANPTPASPIFSSVLAMDFPESLETNTAGFKIALSDHHTLKSNASLALTNIAGEETSLRLVVDFADYLPEPRPNFAENVRHSHPYGIVADNAYLYIVDGGLNGLRKVEVSTGHEETLASFPPTRSPLTNGPPVIENVPTSIHWVDSQLVVTIFGGAPFLPGFSKVVQIHPQTGTVVSLVEGLTTAIDSTPLAVNSLSGGVLVLEYDLSFPQPGLGRLQSFAVPAGNSVAHSTCLVTPSSMLIDRNAGRLILSELGTGRLVWIPAPPSLSKAGHIYFSETGGGRIGRANLDGTAKVTLLSGLPAPVGPTLDPAHGHMYWGELGGATMQRANLDRTGQATLIKSPNGGSPALDLARGRMYWSVSGSGNIRSANLDGSGQQVLITGLSVPHAPVLDLAAGKIYWADYGDGDVRRANLDGTGQQTLVSGIPSSSLVALDVAGGKMYWTVQRANGEIRRANLDGSGQEIVVRNQNAPSGIALDINNGHIYWANFEGGDIRRANLDGSNQQVLITGLSGLAVITLDLSLVTPLKIQGAAKSDGAFTLNWSSAIGRSYQVQFSTNLARTTWTSLGTRHTATNAAMTALDSITADPQRFYRVQLVP